MALYKFLISTIYIYVGHLECIDYYVNNLIKVLGTDRDIGFQFKYLRLNVKSIKISQ